MTDTLLYDSAGFGEDDGEDDFDTDEDHESFRLEERILDEDDDFGTKVPGKRPRRKGD